MERECKRRKVGASSAKKRPARKQTSKPMGPSMTVEKKANYNIWYGRQMGRQNRSKTLSKTRCNPSLDSGFTKASDTKDGAFICLYFAKGMCALGQNCTYLHRIPRKSDEAKCGLTKDVFGRDRHSDDRDDMGGIGTFNRENTSLYVGGICAKNGSKVAMEEQARKHFGDFGSIVSVKALPQKGVIFVQYACRVQAEFAKEAMSNQSMESKQEGEVLNVRWATEDPNPGRKRREAIATSERLASAVIHKAQQMRNQLGGDSAAAVHPMASLDPSSQYPDTESQYAEQITVPAVSFTQQELDSMVFESNPPVAPKTRTNPIVDDTSNAAAAETAEDTAIGGGLSGLACYMYGSDSDST